MGIESEFLEEQDLLIMVWDGTVTGSEWEAFVTARIASDPRWPCGGRRLVDITSLDPSTLGSDDVAVVVGKYHERSANIVGTRTAIVASRGWAIATEFERSIDTLGSTTVVFNHLPEACGWLDVELAHAKSVIASIRAELRAS